MNDFETILTQAVKDLAKIGEPKQHSFRNHAGELINNGQFIKRTNPFNVILKSQGLFITPKGVYKHGKKI